MSAAVLPLDDLQRWMQEVVVHPGAIGEALAARTELTPERLGEVLLPSATLTAAERLGVYHEMYLLRMLDVLGSDYYALAHFLGPHAFIELVRAYVDAHPSTSFSLNGLGRRLPGFVRTRAGLPRRAFCYDLARLERAVTEVFDARETPPISVEEIGAIPIEAWERAVLQPVEAVRLMRFRHPVNAYLQSVRDDDHDNHPPARRRATWLAVYRRDYSVYRLELSEAAYDLLGDLVRGRPLGEAIGAAARRRGRRAVEPTTLAGWFRDWVAGGLFASIRVD